MPASCELLDPSYAENFFLNTAIAADLMVASLLLADRARSQQALLGAPLSRAMLRDQLLDLFAVSDMHTTCSYPDLASCRLAIQNAQPIHYSGFSSPLIFAPDGRMTYLYVADDLYSVSSEGQYTLLKSYPPIERIKLPSPAPTPPRCP